MEWIASGRVNAVSVGDGSYRLKISAETHRHSGSLSQGFYVLDLWPARLTEEGRKEWDRELLRKQRERSLLGLSPGPLKVDVFVRAVAERFAAVVPESMHVSVDDGMVWLVSGSGGRVLIFGLAGMRDGDDPVDVVRSAAEDALATAQEYVSEDTTEPWPASGQLPGGFPTPLAQIADGQLRMLYGAPEAPVLELVPIRLTDILARGNEC